MLLANNSNEFVARFLQKRYDILASEWCRAMNCEEASLLEKLDALIIYAKTECVHIKEEEFIKAAQAARAGYLVCRCKRCGMPIYNYEEPTCTSVYSGDSVDLVYECKQCKQKMRVKKA